MENFEKECMEIVQDPFGNYAIQHVLEVYGSSLSIGIINEIKNNILSLSMQKFSSNVVEKCIEYSNYVINYLMI